MKTVLSLSVCLGLVLGTVSAFADEPKKVSPASADEMAARIDVLEQQCSKNTRTIEELSAKVAEHDQMLSYNTGLIGVGMMLPVSGSDGSTVLSLNAGLGPVTAGYVFGQGFQVVVDGIDLISTNRTDVNLFDIGALVYTGDAKMHSEGTDRVADILLSPVSVKYRVWGNDSNTFGLTVGTALGWAIPTPDAAYKAANDGWNSVEGNPSLEAPSSQDDLESGETEAVGRDSVDEVEERAESAGDAAGQIYQKAVQTVFLGFTVSGVF